MVRLILLLAAFLTIGCDTTDPKNDSGATPQIKTGLYETKQNVSIDGEFYTLNLQVHFEAKQYRASGFVGELEIRQEKGTWVQSSGTVNTSERLYRALNDAGSWGPWVSDTNGAMQIRNVTGTSFQKYLDASDIDASVKGLSPGWLTYNRIGE